jgi:hypothetical protein
LVTLVSRRVQGLGDDAQVIAALNNMKTISSAVKAFHCDFGFVPEEVERAKVYEDRKDDKRNLNPAYVTRFLCLEKDCGDEKIMTYMEDQFLDYPYFDIFEEGYAGCHAMARFLRDLLGKHLKDAQNSTYLQQLLHDSSTGQGWRGRYATGNAFFNAAAWDDGRDDETYPEDSPPVNLPLIATPWAQELEEAAREAQRTQMPERADEYRQAKYYQIRVRTTFECVDRRGTGNCAIREWKQHNETARIVCLGANGRDDGGTRYPLPDDIGDDMVMFVFGNEPFRSPLDG